MTQTRRYDRIIGQVEAYQTEHNMTIVTPQGRLKAQPGDWIVSANGKTWVCEQDVFPMLYKLSTPPQPPGDITRFAEDMRLIDAYVKTTISKEQ